MSVDERAECTPLRPYNWRLEAAGDRLISERVTGAPRQDIMAPGQSVEGLATEKLLRYLALELDAVGAVRGHGAYLRFSRPCQSSHPNPSASRGALHTSGEYSLGTDRP